MRRWAVLTAFSLLVLPSCGRPDAVPDVEVSREGRLPAEALGRCGKGQEPAPVPLFHRASSTRPWITNLLDPGVWVRVERIDASGARRNTQKQHPGRYVTVGGEPELVAARPATADRLRTDGYLAKSVDAALRTGAEVYLRYDAHQGLRLAVALRGREYAFLGRCAYRPVPLAAEVFGPYVAEYLTALVGTSRAETLEVMGYGGEPERVPWLAEPGLRMLRPGATPADVLRALPRGTVEVRAPASWRGRARLCLLMYLGASGCVDLRDPRPRTFYYEPGRPDLSLFVRFPDGALRLLKPVTLPGAKGVRVTVTLAAEPSLREVLRGNATDGHPDAVRAVRVAAR
jgi:hypothetical protein